MMAKSSVGDLRGKTAIVTGAASGIGRALAVRLAQQGATVLAADRDEAGLANLVDAMPSLNLIRHPLDVTDRAAVFAAVDRAVSDTGRLDFMFNNAGIVVGGDFDQMTDEVWRRIVDINLWGVIYGTEAAFAQMRKQGNGHIVNTSSSAGVMPVVRSAAYATTKHAVVGLSTSLRAEAAPHGIAVSVVIPGMVDTNIFGSATNLDGYNYQAAVDKVPMHKVSPTQAADAILRGVAKNRSFIVFPLVNQVIVALQRAFPTVMHPLMARSGM
ncbi:SDR family NAD(P)-dependent oxidoreductase [Mycobacterium timonense]|jgi:NAD(P)-dependent dehydrogenase (short-subunit alcohol dehydrogenase family)|uniref:Short-chain dehydrogenase n=1 Tax=Mycobacterium timonense TaxID=701043 RepID=A0A7I9Z944_9MYCO|nr:SDR family oxidoreductase [Mycobacterium timonense]GFG97346.1 short-chain dehydrogenase [Mycobacterium timonense]